MVILWGNVDEVRNRWLGWYCGSGGCGEMRESIGWWNVVEGNRSSGVSYACAAELCGGSGGVSRETAHSLGTVVDHGLKG